MDALTIIRLCAREYNDVGYVRIGRDATSFTSTTNGANWLDWLNDAQRAIVLVRPDAGAITENFTLVAGTKQTLPATRMRLLDVIRNMGDDGATPGKTIRFVDHESKGDLNRDWHTASDATSVREVIYDEKKAPRTFYVSPPAPGYRIELVAVRVPDDIEDADVESADFDLDALYAGPAQAWMLHRAYAMASSAPSNQQKAWQYFSSFFQQLGVKLRAEMFTGVFTPGAHVMQGGQGG